MKGWESPFIFSYQQHGTMIEEQRVSDFNPLYTLANVTRFPVQFPSYLRTGSYTHRVSLSPKYKLNFSCHHFID